MRTNILIILVLSGFFIVCISQAENVSPIEEKWLSLGNTYVSQEKYDDAIKAYDSAIQLNPLSDRAYNAKGVIFLRIGECVNASLNFKQAIKIAPNNSVLLMNLALAEECSGETDNTISTLYGVLNNNSQDATAWMSLGSIQEQNGNYSEALLAYNKAIIINQSNGDAWLRKSILLAHIGQYIEAMDSFNATRNISPDNPTVMYNQGVLLEKLNRLEDAIRLYEEVIAIEPNSSKAWFNKGSILYNRNRLSESLIALDTALSIDPNISEAWFTRGQILKSLGEYNESSASFERAYQINPDDSMYRAYRERYKQVSDFNKKKRIIPLSISTILLSILLSIGVVRIIRKKVN